MQTCGLTLLPTTEDSSNVAIGVRLRSWRRYNKLTQPEMAEKLSVSVDTLRRYETGMSSPTAAFLALIYQYGVNMNWLLTGGDSMHRESLKFEETAEEKAIKELCEALSELRKEAPSKFNMLTKGFTARAREAAHLARLEQQVSGSARGKPDPQPPAQVMGDEFDIEDNKDILTAPIPAPSRKEPDPST